MECLDNCWILSPPALPPPPPLPQFLSYLNLTVDCDLCNWAGVNVHVNSDLQATTIQLSSLLIIVGLVSACFGAGIMAAILSIKRIRGCGNRGNTSVRHLSRKCEDSNTHAAGPIGTEGFPTSSSFSENTYCDGPYTNIYAELHTPTTGNIWNRPSMSPSTENCYLELTDLPIHESTDQKGIQPWFMENSPKNPSYYGDLDLSKRSPN